MMYRYYHISFLPTTRQVHSKTPATRQEEGGELAVARTAVSGVDCRVSRIDTMLSPPASLPTTTWGLNNTRDRNDPKLSQQTHAKYLAYPPLPKNVHIKARMFDEEAALLPSLRGREAIGLIAKVAEGEEAAVEEALAALEAGTPEEDKERLTKASRIIFSHDTFSTVEWR